MAYIEDILHILVDTIGVDSSDTQIMNSISNQAKKGVALTDRQYELVKQKIHDRYLNVLKDNNVEFDNLSTRLPLRQIDRSKHIKIVSTAEVYEDSVVENYKVNWSWIEIRFPFSKKDIVIVETIANKHRKFYYHRRGSHTHYFKLHEPIIKDVVSAFNKKSFSIDQTLLQYYNEIIEIENNKNNHIPLYDKDFFNVDPKVLNNIDAEIGQINSNNFVKLVDRRFRYGIEIVNPVANGLKGVIALRNNTMIAINPQEFSLNQIAEALMQLDRFPLLIVVDREHELEQVSTIYNTFNGIVSSKKQTVLFRVENNDSRYNLNNYVHDKGLNNWLDATTEIVYINKNKLPKLLLNTDWKPMCALHLTSIRSTSQVSCYINDNIDLSIYHDKDTGMFNQRNVYGYL